MPANHMASLNCGNISLVALLPPRTLPFPSNCPCPRSPHSVAAFPSSLGTPRAISTMMKPRCNYQIGLSLVALMRAYSIMNLNLEMADRLDQKG